jgi:hypothetical protein
MRSFALDPTLQLIADIDQWNLSLKLAKELSPA